MLEDLFTSEGSEVYIKDIGFYAPLGQPVTFEQLMVAAISRREVVLGLQIHSEDASTRYGLTLNPSLKARRTPFVPKPKDRLVVLAEDDG